MQFLECPLEAVSKSEGLPIRSNNQMPTFTTEKTHLHPAGKKQFWSLQLILMFVHTGMRGYFFFVNVSVKTDHVTRTAANSFNPKIILQIKPNIYVHF